MEPEVVRQLLELNASFYQTFADEFSSTRQHLQPGVVSVLNTLKISSGQVDGSSRDWMGSPLPFQSILDLGCGNGGLCLHLAGSGFRGSYTGLDFSPALLEIARRRFAGLPGTSHRLIASFIQADLARVNLEELFPGQRFEAILAFAVLHHLPGAQNRLDLLRQVRACLAPGGYFIHSEWQFLRSQRWANRVILWDLVGLARTDVEPDDYLLDWRATGGKAVPGLRYVHYFSEKELASLAADTGFRILYTFSSDGREGDLSLYQVWEALS